MTLPQAADHVAEPVLAGDSGPGGVRSRVVAGVAQIVVRGALVRVAGLVTSTVLARLLSPADFGLLAFGLTVIALGGFLTEIGLAAHLLRSAEEPTSADLRTLLGTQLAATSALAVAVAVVAVPRGSAGAIAAIFTATLVLQAIRSPALVQLERHLRYKEVARAEVADTVVYGLLAVGLVLAGLQVWGVVIATVLRTLPGTCLLLQAAPLTVLRPGFDRQRFRLMAAFGLRVQSLGALTLVRDQGVNLYTIAVAGSSTLGLWSMSQRVMLVPFLVFDSLWRVSFPGMARLVQQGADLRADVEKALRLGALATALTVVGISAASPLLLPSLLGPAWAAAGPVLPLSALGLLLSGPVSAAGAGYLLATGRAGRVGAALLAMLVEWAVVLPLLLPRLGVVAHGVAWLGACVVEALLLGSALSRSAGVRVLRALVAPVLTAVPVAGGGYLVAQQLPVTLGATVAVGAVSTAVFVLLAAVVARPALLELVALGRRFLPTSLSRRRASWARV